MPNFASDSVPAPVRVAAAPESGFFEELGRSFVYSGLQSPINGLAQLTDHATSAIAGVVGAKGTNILPHIQFIEAPAEAKFGTGNWYAQQFGGSIGVAADFWLLHKGVGSARGGIASGAALETTSLTSLGMVRQSAVAGALYGGILVPVRPDENNFWQSRLRNSAVQSATFATLSGASIGISEMGQAFKSAPRLASFLSNDIAAGTLSAVPAGLVNANSESILNGHGFASGADTGKSIYSFAVIGGTLAIGNKAMAKIAESRVEIPVGGNETPQESAQILGLKLPKMTDGQQALAEATIVEPKRDGRGSMQHEKYKATAQLSDGSEHDVIVRAFPRGWWATSRFRYEQAAYHLNKMIGLDNGFPTTALRTFEKDGNLTRAWVQDASGRTFGEAIEDLARQRYGSSSDDAVSKLVKEDHPLRLQIQQAFVERFLYGDTDPSAFNMVMHQQPNLRVQNIDLDMAFHGDPTPGVTSSPAYGVNHRLFSDFANQPLPASLHSKLSQFVRNYDNLPGRTKIMELGLTGGETSGLMARARWFVRNGIFPESHSLSL